MKFKIFCLFLCYSPVLLAQDCTSFAGTFELSPVELCLSETALAAFQNDQILDDDDLLQFVLHTNDTDELGTIIYTQNQPLLEFISGMTVETTYYLSAIVGNNSGGMVDLDDPCLSVSVGVPVFFLGLPAARLGLDTLICSGSSIDIPVQFEGDGPYTFNWLEDGSIIGNFTATTDTFFTVQPSQYTVFSISNLVGSACPGVTIGVTTVGLDTVLTVEDVLIECVDSTYILGFNIFGDSPENFEVEGWSGGFFANSFISDPIPIDTPYQLFVSNGGPCPAVELTGIDSCGCGILEGGLMSQEPLLVCENEMASGILLEFPSFDERYDLYYVLHNRSDEQLGQLFGFSFTNQFAFTDNLNFDSTYYISAVVGPVENGVPLFNSTCLLVLPGHPIRFTPVPDMPLSLNAPFELCPDQSLQLDIDANDEDIINYGFALPSGDTIFQDAPSLIIDSINATGNGDYFGFVSNENCTSDPFGPVPVAVLNCEAFILSNDISLCEPSTVFLQAAPLGINCEGIWKTNSSASIDNPFSPQVTIQNLAIGDNEFIWTTNEGSDCENSDTVIISVSAPPVLADDLYQISLGENRIRFKPYENDQLNGTPINGNTFSIESTPEKGQLVFEESTGLVEFVITGELEDTKSISFIYSICNPVCLGSCAEAQVTINLPDILVGIPEGFTPNNDGTNDQLRIRNIEAYPENQIIIANRWGDIVYQRRNYSNDQAWDGRFQDNFLPQGVYYLQLSIDGQEPITGSIHLIR